MRRATLPLIARLTLGWILVLGLPGTQAAAADGVTLWDRHGLWGITTTLDCMGPRSMGGIQAIYAMGPDASGLGDIAGQPVGLGTGGFIGDMKGKGGRVLKGIVESDGCGVGRFKFELAGDMRTFEGKMKFLGQKGTVTGRYIGDAADRYGLTLHLAFSAAKRGALKPGKNAVLVVVVENAGPQPLPISTALLRLRFSGAVGFRKVALIKKKSLARFDFGVDLNPDVPQTDLHLPIAVGQLTTIAAKFLVPAALAGTTLKVLGDFIEDPDSIDRLGQNPPPIPTATAETEIEIEGGGELRIRFKLKNKEPSGPGRENIHIFLLDDPDPFSERTRIAAGGSKTLKVSAQPGQTFSFGAGRGGVTFDTCTTGPAVRSGRGTVTWDPVNFPSFLALGCPGGA